MIKRTVMVVIAAMLASGNLCVAADEDTKAIQVLLNESITAYESKDKETVVKFLQEKTAFAARKDGETHDSLFAGAKQHFMDKKQTSFENNCNSMSRAQKGLVGLAPKVMDVPENDPKFVKKLARFRYPNEKKDEHARIGDIEKVAQIRGPKANVKLLKANGQWLMCFN